MDTEKLKRVLRRHLASGWMFIDHKLRAPEDCEEMGDAKDTSDDESRRGGGRYVIAGGTCDTTTREVDASCEKTMRHLIGWIGAARVTGPILCDARLCQHAVTCVQQASDQAIVVVSALRRKRVNHKKRKRRGKTHTRDGSTERTNWDPAADVMIEELKRVKYGLEMKVLPLLGVQSQTRMENVHDDDDDNDNSSEENSDEVSADQALQIAVALDEVYHSLVYAKQRTDIEAGPRVRAMLDAVPMPHRWFEEIATLYPKYKRTAQEFLMSCAEDEGIERMALFLKNFDWVVSGRPTPGYSWTEYPHISNRGFTNPLLRLHRARLMEAVHLIYARKSCSAHDRRYKRGKRYYKTAAEHEAVKQFRRRQEQMHSKKNEQDDTTPPLAPIHSQFADASRTFSCFVYAFATPNTEAINALRRHSPILEMGAGTAYWAFHMREAGIDVRAIDLAPTKDVANEYHGRSKTWTHVKEGDPSTSISDANGEAGTRIDLHRTLFLCYPPPKDASRMALRALQSHYRHRAKVQRDRMSTVIVVGEWLGDTADVDFDRFLMKHYYLVERITLPNWVDTAHDMTVWCCREHVDARNQLASSPSTATVSVKPKPKLFVHSSTGGRITLPIPMSCATCGKHLDASPLDSETARNMIICPDADPEARRREHQCHIVSSLRRCFYCRDPLGTFCSEECCHSGAADHNVVHRQRMIVLSENTHRSFSSDIHYERLTNWIL